MTSQDKRGQDFIEVPTSGGEHVRVTYIERAEWLAGEPSIRIQKRDAKGRIVFGPELPADRAVDLIGAISELVRRRKP